MIYIISQIIALLAFIFSITAYHRTKKEKIMLNMVISHTLNLIHYLILGAYSGCTTKLLAAIRDFFIIIKDKKKINSRFYLYIFLIIYLIMLVITYENIYMSFPLIAAIIYLLSSWNGNELIVKKTAFISYFLWLIYNICIFSMVAIFTNIISIISTFIAIHNHKK